MLEAEAERANLEAVAAGEAFEQREVGRAKADAVLAVGESEAEAMRKKAEAYKEYEAAAVLELLVSRLPEVARAIADPISNVDSITIIDTEGASKLTKTAANTMTQLDAMFKGLTGSGLTDLVGRVLEGNGAAGNGSTTKPDGEGQGTK